MADINLTGDASSLIRALQAASRALKGFEQNVGGLPKNVGVVTSTTNLLTVAIDKLTGTVNKLGASSGKAGGVYKKLGKSAQEATKGISNYKSILSQSEQQTIGAARVQKILKEKYGSTRVSLDALTKAQALAKSELKQTITLEEQLIQTLNRVAAAAARGGAVRRPSGTEIGRFGGISEDTVSIQGKALLTTESDRLRISALRLRNIQRQQGLLSGELKRAKELQRIEAQRAAGGGGRGSLGIGLPAPPGGGPPDRTGGLGVKGLRNQTAQLARSANDSANAFVRLREVAKGLARITGVALFIGAAFRLQQALEESFQAALDLSRAVAEIQTVQAGAITTTDQWTRSLTALSDEFGIDVLDQAEAAYQTLSNQIRNSADEALSSAETLEFLRVANQLAVTAVTDTSTSVSLLTATLNAFKIPAEDAERSAAILFKTVELGRIRADELSKSFGNIAVPAAQLGLTLEETNAALATLTVQGVQVAEAQTFLRNVILKLIRPTERLKEVFKELGISNADAGIAAFGFPGLLNKITNATDGSTTAIGALVGRIRGMLGLFGLTGDAFEGFAENVKQLEATSLKDFAEDTKRVLQSAGKIIEIEINKIRNFFTVEFGQEFLKSIAKSTQAFGGFETVAKTLSGALRTLGSAGIAFVASLILTKLIPAQKAFILQTEAMKTAARANVYVQLATAIIAASEAFAVFAKNALGAAEAANLAFIAANDAQTSETEKAQRERLRFISLILKEQVAKAAAAAIEENKIRNESVEKQIKDLERLDIALDGITKEASKELKENLKDLDSQINDLEKSATQAAELVNAIFEKASQQQFKFALDEGGTRRQLELLGTRIQNIQGQAETTSLAGDLDAFKDARKELNSLSTQRLKIASSINKTEIEYENRLFELRQKFLKSQSASERDSLKKQIRDISRERGVAGTGSAAELKIQKEITKEREKARQEAAGPEKDNAIIKARSLLRMQEQIQESATKERIEREKIVAAQVKQAAQATEIAKKNLEAIKAAEIQKAKVRDLELAFEFVKDRVQDFDTEEALALGTANEVTKAINEQQINLARLARLQSQIGGGEEARKVVIQEQTRLQKAANEAIATLQQAERDQAVKANRKEVEKKLNAAIALQREEDKGLASVQARLNTLSKVFAQDPADFFAGLGDISASLLNLTDETQDKLLGTLRSEVKEIQDLIAEARKPGGTVDQAAVNQGIESLRKLMVGLVTDAARWRPGHGEGIVRFAAIGGTADAAQDPWEAGIRDLISSLGGFTERETATLSALGEGFGTLGTLERGKLVEESQARAATVRGLEKELGVTDAIIKARKADILSTLATVKEVLNFKDSIALAEDSIFKLNQSLRGEGPLKKQATTTGVLGPGAASLDAELTDAFTEGANLLEEGVRRGLQQGAVDVQGTLTTAQREAIKANRATYVDAGREQGEAQATAAIEAAEKAVADAEASQKTARDRLAKERETQQATGLSTSDRRKQAAEQRAANRALQREQANLIQDARIAAADPKQTLEQVTAARRGATGVDETGQLIALADVTKTAVEAETQLNALRQERISVEQTLSAIQLQIIQRSTDFLTARVDLARVEKSLEAQKLEEAAATASVTSGLKQLQEAFVRRAALFESFGFGSGPEPTIIGLPGFAAGGTVHGPGGTDRVPAMLTAGEFVMNKLSTQKFFPQLMAMNSGVRPRGFADGGPVNVGGVNVSVTESVNPQVTARKVVAEINRGLRLKSFKFKE